MCSTPEGPKRDSRSPSSSLLSLMQLCVSHLMPKERVKKERPTKVTQDEECMDDELGELIEGSEWFVITNDCDDDD